MVSSTSRHVLTFLGRAAFVACAAVIGALLFVALARFGGEFLGHNSFTATMFAGFMTCYCLRGWMRAMARGRQDKWSVVVLLTVFLPFAVPAFAFYVAIRACRRTRSAHEPRLR